METTGCAKNCPLLLTASLCCHSFPQHNSSCTGSASFFRGWKKLSVEQRTLVCSKIALLRQNEKHPSLRTHRIKRAARGVWEAYMSDGLRLVYRRIQGGKTILLLDIGAHQVVDRCHQRNY